MKKLLAVLVVPFAAVALTGCSVTVDSSELETQISDALTQQVGEAPDDVTCPEDLDGEVGATTQCQLTAGDTVLPVDVTVTSVEGNTVNFDIEVGETPIG